MAAPKYFCFAISRFKILNPLKTPLNQKKQVLIETCSRNMAQKSITSFFKRVSTGTIKEASDDESPIKASNSSKRRIESSDEDEDLDRSASMKSVKQKRRIESSDEEDTKKKSPVKTNGKTPSPKAAKAEKKVSPKTKSKSSPKSVKSEKKTPVKSEVASIFKIKSEKKKDDTPAKDQNDSLDQESNGKTVSNIAVKEEKSADSQEVGHNGENGIDKKENEPETSEETGETKPPSKEGDKTPKKEIQMMQLGKSKGGGHADEEAASNYDPSKTNYHPLKDAFWKKDQNTPYLALARTFQVIEETSGRLKMMDILSNYFCSVMLLNPSDLLPSVYLSINQIAPAYEGLELGVAEHSLMKVICQATGRNMQFIKNQNYEIGDLGIVAEQSRVAQRMMFRPAALTVQNVFSKLKIIAKTSGPQKSNMIQDMFIACRLCEARFFIRSLIGKLRIGIAEQSLLTSLAIAVEKKKCLDEGTLSKITPESLKSRAEETGLVIKTAFCQCPNYEKVIPALLEYGVDELLERCPMFPGMPLKPMLAQPTQGVQDVLKRFDGLHITCEWKYDGERAQIHCNDKGVINIYSRNQENNTTKYPDVISRIANFQSENVKTYILDSEIVAWDITEKRILPFQILSTRKRKNVDVNEIKVQVCVYAFDLLYLNGKPLVTEPFVERRRLLKENFKEIEGEWQFATSLDTSDMDEVQQFLEESIKGNCEGLMVKTLEKDATYEIAKRSRNWLKLKKDYLQSCGDSLDLVVIGGYKGKGKRTGCYGGFLLACYDDESEEYQSICKIGTGFSDEDLKTHSAFFKNHILKEAKSYFACESSLEPDEWFEPVQVWEVKCADLSLSPIHKAAIGIVDPERGISLRFPRFIRIRDDKNPDNATSARDVAHMYSSQAQIKNQQTNANEDDDYY